MSQIRTVLSSPPVAASCHAAADPVVSTSSDHPVSTVPQTAQ